MERLFSGIQPSGDLHLGNYLGAIKQWLALQDQYDALFCVVDLHAITVPQDPVVLRKKSLEIAKIYLAAGIDPKKCTLFVQSHVPAHAELGWILNTIATMGELGRMTQFKDKAKILDISRGMVESNSQLGDLVRPLVGKISNGEKLVTEEERKLFEAFVGAWSNSVEQSKESLKSESVNLGLFDYPVLMAADILLYDTGVVPVGEDQKQHIELTRDLAERFNSRFGETFVIPEPLIQREGARIMGLDDPSKKMSKSASSEYNYIALSDDAETIRKKVKKAVTDSGSEIVYSDDKPALRNLINIYTLLSGKKVNEVEEMYRGKGYGDFKEGLAEVIVDFLIPFQERLAAISDEEVLAILKDGGNKAHIIAEEKMKQVRDRIGFLTTK